MTLPLQGESPFTRVDVASAQVTSRMLAGFPGAFIGLVLTMFGTSLTATSLMELEDATTTPMVEFIVNGRASVWVPCAYLVAHRRVILFEEYEERPTPDGDASRRYLVTCAWRDGDFSPAHLVATVTYDGQPSLTGAADRQQLAFGALLQACAL